MLIANAASSGATARCSSSPPSSPPGRACVAAYFIEGQTQIGPVATVLTVAIPVSIYLALIYALYSYLVHAFDPFHSWLLLGTAAIIALSVAMAIAGIDMAVCARHPHAGTGCNGRGYETPGHRHQAAALAANGAAPNDDVASGSC